MDRLQDMRAFVEVARSGSFVRAAELLRQTNSAISKAVARLEKRLGVRLFQRTTRHLLLTDEGRAYLEDCQRILAELEQAEDAVRARRHTPHGTLKLHFPLLWTREAVVPALPDFQRRYPDVRLQLVFTETKIDFRDGYDLSVQVGGSPAGGLVERELCATRSLIVAAPAYLAAHGVPEQPDALAGHQLLRFMQADRQQPVPWFFKLGTRSEPRLFPGAMDFSDPLAMVEAAAAGCGIIQAPDLLLRPYLRSGALEPLLQDWEVAGPSIVMTWPQNRYQSLRLRVFIEWLQSAAEAYRLRQDHGRQGLRVGSGVGVPTQPSSA